MNTLREQFTKETGLTDGIMFVHSVGFRDEYVLWLEQQIPIREQQSFEAARKITPGENYLKPTRYDIDGQVMYELAINYKYQSINEWRSMSSNESNKLDKSDELITPKDKQEPKERREK